MSILFNDAQFPYLIRDEDYPLGGSTVQLYSWIKGLTSINQKVGVLTFKGANEYVKKQLEFDLIETYNTDGIPIIRWVYKRFPSLFKETKLYNPDFIIRSGAGIRTGMLALVGKQLNIPFFYRAANDMDADDRIKDRVPLSARLFYYYGLNKAAGIICQNSYQYENFRRKFPEKKMTILHNPFHIDHPLPEIKRLSERNYIAWIGIFQKQKNMQLLLKIAKLLPEFNFRVAGKSLSATDSQTKLAVEELRKLPNVKFTGYLKRHEIFPFLTDAFFLLNTSHYEGFSNTYLEAFSAGTPVVTSSKTDPDGIIEKNKLGLIINELNRKNDLSGIMENEDEYYRLALHCREYVLTNHNPKYLASRLMEFLESAGNNKKVFNTN